MHVPHIDEDVLDRYALGRLVEPELGQVEEHLLVCAECRARLEVIDAVIRELRAAELNRRRM